MPINHYKIKAFYFITVLLIYRQHIYNEKYGSRLTLLPPSEETVFLSWTCLFRPAFPTWFLPKGQVADLQIVTDLESLTNHTVVFAV